ncbi:MAG: hypothetical protein ACHQT6_07790 [Candidatus Acidiferrales bacterium]
MKFPRNARLFLLWVDRVLFVAVFLFVSGIVFAQKTPLKQPVKSEDEIIAVVVRYAAVSHPEIIFLSVDDQDPSAETLRLLSRWNVRVFPASRAAYVPAPGQAGSWKNKKTGELGTYFAVEAGKYLKDGRVEIAAGWGQPCGTYTLTFGNGAWSVESYKVWDFCF